MSTVAEVFEKLGKITVCAKQHYFLLHSSNFIKGVDSMKFGTFIMRTVVCFYEYSSREHHKKIDLLLCILYEMADVSAYPNC